MKISGAAAECLYGGLSHAALLAPAGMGSDLMWSVGSGIDGGAIPWAPVGSRGPIWGRE
jgi:hypothetical protein